MRKKNPKKLGTVLTFYSYKGGVGRSMAVANVAALLADRGYSVLTVDWDLEAPGLEAYFQSQTARFFSELEYDVNDHPGIVDMLFEPNLDWHSCVNTVKFSDKTLYFISAGQRNENYKSKLQNLDWSALFEEQDLGQRLEDFRQKVKNEYDYIFIDSRTGVTDIGDICTVLLPDILITLFASNIQNIHGCLDIISRSRISRQKLPVNRSRAFVIPIAARDESDSEYDQANYWREQFAEVFSDVLREWLPKTFPVREYFDRIYIPYVPNWSFGERLPVLESPRELVDPKTIGASFLDISRIIESDLSVKSLQRNSLVDFELIHKEEMLEERFNAAVKERVALTMQVSFWSLYIRIIIQTFEWMTPRIISLISLIGGFSVFYILMVNYTPETLQRIFDLLTTAFPLPGNEINQNNSGD